MCYASFYEDINKSYNPSCLFMIKKTKQNKAERSLLVCWRIWQNFKIHIPARAVA